MTFTEVKWQDSDRNTIVAKVDNVLMFIPADPKNRHFAALTEAAVPIADPD